MPIVHHDLIKCTVVGLQWTRHTIYLQQNAVQAYFMNSQGDYVLVVHNTMLDAAIHVAGRLELQSYYVWILLLRQCLSTSPMQDWRLRAKFMYSSAAFIQSSAIRSGQQRPTDECLTRCQDVATIVAGLWKERLASLVKPRRRLALRRSPARPPPSAVAACSTSVNRRFLRNDWDCVELLKNAAAFTCTCVIAPGQPPENRLSFACCRFLSCVLLRFDVRSSSRSSTTVTYS